MKYPFFHQIVLDPGGRLSRYAPAEPWVFVLDPYRIAAVDDVRRRRFNPLDLLDVDDPQVISHAAVLARALCPAEDHDPFWTDKARTLIKALILHVKTAPHFEGRRNLATLADTVSTPDLAELVENPAFGGLIEASGREMQVMRSNVEKQWAGVHATMMDATTFLKDPQLSKHISQTDEIDTAIQNATRSVRLYVCFPEHAEETATRWSRIILDLFAAV